MGLLTILKIIWNQVNQCGPSDVMWWQISVSTLGQSLACCLMTRIHYLKQCWLFISEVLWHPRESNFIGVVQTTILYNKFENYSFKIVATSPRGQWVNLEPHKSHLSTASFVIHHCELCTEHSIQSYCHGLGKDLLIDMDVTSTVCEISLSDGLTVISMDI